MANIVFKNCCQKDCFGLCKPHPKSQQYPVINYLNEHFLKKQRNFMKVFFKILTWHLDF